MFSFWSRKGNKSPAAARPSNVLSQNSQDQDVELPRTTSRVPQLPSVPVQGDQSQTIPADIKPEPVVAAVPNPHDAAVSEVHSKLLQAEQLSSATHPPRSTDPLTETVTLPIPPPLEPLFDPATGTQRGLFESAAPGAPGVALSSGFCDSEQLRDEVWTHLAHIREIQSEIAVMHVHMEGIGDESASIDAEVDNDIDVDTVPTQEEEDAAKRAKEFEKLPGRFKGRSDNIDAMMGKVRLDPFHIGLPISYVLHKLLISDLLAAR